MPQDMPALVMMQKVSRTMGSTDSVPILVKGDGVDSLSSLQLDAGVRGVRARDITADRLTGATSIADLVVQVQRRRDAGDGEPNSGPCSTSIPEATKAAYLSGHDTAQIQVLLDQDGDAGQDGPQGAARGRTSRSRARPPGSSRSPPGRSRSSRSLISDIAENKDTMTVLGFGLVLATLLLVYRKLDAAAPLIPIVAVVGWNAVAMTVLGIDYTPLTATLGAMTIGVAAEYTILVLERFLEEREKTDDVFAAIEHSVQKIGRAITVSGLATLFGFSALCVSTFPMISNFGITTVIAVGFSLIGAIVVMPAALVVVDRAPDPDRAPPRGPNRHRGLTARPSFYPPDANDRS